MTQEKPHKLTAILNPSFNTIISLLVVSPMTKRTEINLQLKSSIEFPFLVDEERNKYNLK